MIQMDDISLIGIFLGISLILNLCFGLFTIGILFPNSTKPKREQNINLIFLILGGLFGIFGSFLVPVLNGDGVFNSTPVKIMVFGLFFYTLISLLYLIYNTPENNFIHE